LHDLDFLMDAFDEDVRDIVKVHVIHGFWKHEDQSRRNLIVRHDSLLSLLYCLNPLLSWLSCLLGTAGRLYRNALTKITGASFEIRQHYSSYCIHARNVWHSPH
jgi:hypothetical protein